MVMNKNYELVNGQTVWEPRKGIVFMSNAFINVTFEYW